VKTADDSASSLVSEANLVHGMWRICDDMDKALWTCEQSHCGVFAEDFPHFVANSAFRVECLFPASAACAPGGILGKASCSEE
jgi:hypothetical protein